MARPCSSLSLRGLGSGVALQSPSASLPGKTQGGDVGPARWKKGDSLVPTIHTDPTECLICFRPATS